jgi:methyl-accepting chemotaxis protein
MRKPQRSISRRLILVAMVWIALSLSGIGIVLSYVFEQTVRDAFADNLTAQLRSVTAALAVDNSGQINVDAPLDDIRYRQVLSGWYWQITGPEGVLVRSRSLWDETLPAVEGARPGIIASSDMKGPRGQALQAAFTIVNRKDATGLLLVVAADTAPRDAQIQRFNRIVFAALGTLGVGLAVAVVLQVIIGLKPLRRLTVQLKAIRDGDHNQLPDGHPLEVAPLVDAFNDVLKHDAETLARARREVGNLAHSLKTPLAQMTANLDSLPHGARATLVAHINDLRAKIDFYAARAATAGNSQRGLRATVQFPARMSDA